MGTGTGKWYKVIDVKCNQDISMVYLFFILEIIQNEEKKLSNQNKIILVILVNWKESSPL